MAKLLRDFLRHTLHRRDGNLVSLDSPYPVLARLLRGRQVHGVLDAGASDGRITRRLLQRFPQAQAYLFEPNPKYAAALQDLAQRDPRVHPFALALADQAGTRTFFETADVGSSSLYRPLQQSAATGQTVTAVTLDEWRHEQGDPPVEVMKFDIQGGELAALRGAVRTLRDTTLAIYSEVLFVRQYEGGAIFSELDLFLREHSFELYNIFKPRSDRRDALQWANAIFWNRAKLTH